MNRILIVDEDVGNRDVIACFLGKHGMSARGVSDVLTMRKSLQEEQVDLVLLDHVVDGDDGLSTLRWLRNASSRPALPVVMVTRGDEVDRVTALELGADDCVPRPVAPRELVARIRAVLRRVRPEGQVGPALEAGVRYVRFGDWRLDRIERCLLAQDGTISQMSGAEYSLLCFFLQHPGRVLSRDRLLTHLVGSSRALLDRSIDLRISRLRRLLGDAESTHYIRTVRNEGYVFSKALETMP